MGNQYEYIIIGLSAAGYYALEVLKKDCPEASILAISEEHNLPYKRTSVDKNWKDWDQDYSKKEPFALADRSWYRENKIHLMTGCLVSEINPEEKYICTQTGEKYFFNKLLLALGSRSWKPAVPLLLKAYALRTFRDAIVLKEAAENRKRCLVYGLGVEGVEIAVQLRSLGLDVTLTGRGDHLINLQFSRTFSKMMEDILINNGIDICFNLDLEDIETHGEMLVYSLGIRPRKELAEKAGLDCGKGIKVDTRLRTSCKDIFAAGECAEHSGEFCSGLWHEAQEQGRIAAGNMCGKDSVYKRTNRRLKTELFGGYFFSLVPPSVRGNDSVVIKEIQRGDKGLLHLHLLNGKIAGIEMAHDSDWAKIYEKAVLENWSEQQLLETINPV